METTEKTGGIVSMSETQYERLESLIMSMKDDLSAVKTDVEVIKTSVKDYPQKVEMVIQHDTDIKLIKQRCLDVQSAKEKKVVQPGAIKTGIIVGVCVGTLISIVNLIIAYLS